MPKKSDYDKLKEIAEEPEKETENELPEEIVQLIENGQLPEDIVEGLQSGEISVEQLLEYLSNPVTDEFKEEVEQKIKKLGIFESDENDFKALLFYSLGFFDELSAKQAEEAMKQNEEYQVNTFMKKAEIIRKITETIFGKLPEKDYYVGGFKEIKNFRGKIPHEEMMEMAKFCAENVSIDEALQANPKLLRKTFKEQLPSIKGIGMATKYRAFLKEKFEKYKEQDRPDKEIVIFELLILFKVVESVYLSVKEPKEE